MMAVAPVSAVAVKASGLAASGLAAPALIVTEQVQLAVVAGVFNLILNGMTLYYAKKNKNDAEALKEVAQVNTDHIRETHDIVERRAKPRQKVDHAD